MRVLPLDLALSIGLGSARGGAHVFASVRLGRGAHGFMNPRAALTDNALDPGMAYLAAPRLVHPMEIGFASMIISDHPR